MIPLHPFTRASRSPGTLFPNIPLVCKAVDWYSPK